MYHSNHNKDLKLKSFIMNKNKIIINNNIIKIIIKKTAFGQELQAVEKAVCPLKL